MCLYSLFIGLNNAENEWATLPLAERYGRLPLGVYYMLTSKLGFRTDFPWSRYVEWAARTPQVKLLEQRALPPFGHFSLVRYRKLAG